jgi:hypothetical protein
MDLQAKIRKIEDHPLTPDILSGQFILALRMAVESGLTEEEIISLILLHSGLRRTKKKFGKNALIERVTKIVEVMTQDEFL